MPALHDATRRFLALYPPTVALAQTACPDCGQAVLIDWLIGEGVCYGPACGATWHLTVDPQTLPSWPFRSAMADVVCWACGSRASADCLRGVVQCKNESCGNAGTLRQWILRAENPMTMNLIHP